MHVLLQTWRNELSTMEKRFTQCRELVFIPFSHFSVFFFSANTGATATLTSCARHEVWGNGQGEGLELRVSGAGVVGGLGNQCDGWGLRPSSAVQYAPTRKVWPKAPWRGGGGRHKGLTCPQAAFNTEAPGTECDRKSSVFSNKIRDLKMCAHAWMRKKAAPPTQRRLWSENGTEKKPEDDSRTATTTVTAESEVRKLSVSLCVCLCKWQMVSRRAELQRERGRNMCMWSTVHDSCSRGVHESEMAELWRVPPGLQHVLLGGWPP